MLISRGEGSSVNRGCYLVRFPLESAILPLKGRYNKPFFEIDIQTGGGIGLLFLQGNYNNIKEKDYCGIRYESEFLLIITRLFSVYKNRHNKFRFLTCRSSLFSREGIKPISVSIMALRRVIQQGVSVGHCETIQVSFQKQFPNSRSFQVQSIRRGNLLRIIENRSPHSSAGSPIPRIVGKNAGSSVPRFKTVPCNDHPSRWMR